DTAFSLQKPWCGTSAPLPCTPPSHENVMLNSQAKHLPGEPAQSLAPPPGSSRGEREYSPALHSASSFRIQRRQNMQGFITGNQPARNQAAAMRVNALVQTAYSLSRDHSDPEHSYNDLRVMLGSTRDDKYHQELSFANGDF